MFAITVPLIGSILRRLICMLCWSVPLFTLFGDGFPSLFQEVALGSLKSGFSNWIDSVDVSLYFTEAIALCYYGGLACLTSFLMYFYSQQSFGFLDFDIEFTQR